MQRRRFIRGLLRTSALASAVATLALSTPLAQAQAAWPAKPVRIVVAGPAGGSADIVARVLADMLTKQTGQTVRERLMEVGFEPGQARTPEQLSASLKTDYDRVGAVLQSIGFKPE